MHELGKRNTLMTHFSLTIFSVIITQFSFTTLSVLMTWFSFMIFSVVIDSISVDDSQYSWNECFIITLLPWKYMNNIHTYKYIYMCASVCIYMCV
jgi:hypothetical protein